MDEQAYTPNPPNKQPSRRQILKGAGVIGGAVALGIGGGVYALRTLSGGSGGGPDSRTSPEGSGEPPSLERLADNVVSGGPGKDGIPAIDKPKFVDAGKARFLTDDEPVFGLEHPHLPRAYPQLVLVWHEIVNDTVDGKPLTVTYCPLTGTAIAFTGPPDGSALTFGTTGNLVNSNLVMYDRQTDSTWPQITGTAITGKRKGQRLATTPLLWTTWKAWRSAHPDTQVLSTDTGHLRDYGSDPYGSYTRNSGYYTEGGPIFPVLERDKRERFADKDVVIAIRAGKRQLALPKARLKQDGTVRAKAGGVPVTVTWDRKLAAARVDGAEDAFDAMWFAWYAFHPDTEVLV
ncbi:DUF3179 domain-containing (seleno)protein [Streptomyces gobiensis]|uniref:DUF3179 domain-containing (seleno)protein n=1 Tax=Streptomyces gobiensis TaxID=2875706 RepID=UPI001E63842E|nr:DUF3179 domain-containing (seleno)protein [Streptomyces gobiensis]UGY94613.1 DUF3179 domain-containing protein [Streptomyces gobiensis]